ncbi:MAG: DUF177 domain-containing protein [Lachnospiraceae bacterium]
MLLDLSGVMSEQHTELIQDVDIDMTEFSTGYGSFPILKKTPVSIRVTHVKEHRFQITGSGRVTFSVPCDRCLEPVETEIVLDFVKNVDLNVPDGEQADELDETNYIDGYTLDADKLIRGEILTGWPTKILCSEDCKGICNVCGQNLNQGTCNCEDTGLDPRMSVIRDVFKNFKEV